MVGAELVDLLERAAGHHGALPMRTKLKLDNLAVPALRVRRSTVGPRRSLGFFVAVCICVSAGGQAFAQGAAELEPSSPSVGPTPARFVNCLPSCRKGFFCSRGQCVSACNPPFLAEGRGPQADNEREVICSITHGSFLESWPWWFRASPLPLHTRRPFPTPSIKT